MRSEKEKMLAGELYDASDPELQADLAATQRWLTLYNAALGASAGERRALLLERLAAVGDGAVIRPPFHCDYGFNISLGARVFLNFNCVILDVTEVQIGDGTQIGPAVDLWKLPFTTVDPVAGSCPTPDLAQMERAHNGGGAHGAQHHGPPSVAPMGERSSPAAMLLCRNRVASQKPADTTAPSASARRNPRYSLRVPISTAPTAGPARKIMP
jgi:acetyltransferase-like isoleucine patch superfamily enzyme